MAPRSQNDKRSRSAGWCSLLSIPKRYVFSCSLNALRDKLLSRRVDGKLFQIDGPWEKCAWKMFSGSVNKTRLVSLFVVDW